MYKTSLEMNDLVSHDAMKHGVVQAVASDKGLTRLLWQQKPFETDKDIPERENHVSRETIQQLRAYLKGDLCKFDLPFDFSDMTNAQQTWLNALNKVPYGTVVTYADLAAIWGNERAGRAAGNECARNPMPIILPCHRIISSNGSIENYGGGDEGNPKNPENIQRKQWLIQHEKNHKP